MFLNLAQIGQIAFAVSDVERSEAFYRDVLRLRKLFRFSDLTFFDCAGVRPMLEKAHDGNVCGIGVPYYRRPDITVAVAELEGRGVRFSSQWRLIARMDDHDLWMSLFTDPDGHQHALMHEAPKGWALPN
ncbi:VOC family protein [Roseiarcus sp.]|uniref:VOC family protein n=1 Tax=Roseiarcus sp. TaxID=1969460 RepID=UPI003F9A2C70